MGGVFAMAGPAAYPLNDCSAHRRGCMEPFTHGGARARPSLDAVSGCSWISCARFCHVFTPAMASSTRHAKASSSCLATVLYST